MISYLGRDTYLRLAGATKTAIKAVGGSTRAAEIIGSMRCRQHVERWYATDATNLERSIPLNAIIDIETDIVESGGMPPITQALAEVHGFTLSRMPEAAPDVHPLKAAGDMAREFGEALDSITSAYADGELTGDEQAECLSDLRDLAQRVNDTIAILAGQQIVTIRRAK